MADSLVQSAEQIAIHPCFTLFPTLPAELRLRIWEITLTEPRTVTLTCDKPTVASLQPSAIRNAHVFRSDLRPPSLLHVNRESRDEALQVYKPYFKTSRIKNNTYVSGQSYIYIAFHLDTLKFSDSILSYLAETELQSIRHLILDVRDCAYFGHFNMDNVKRMKNLKTLDMWADRYTITSWNGADAYVKDLTKCFVETKEIDPGWECPDVRVFNRQSKMLVKTVEGGAAIPGWTE